MTIPSAWSAKVGPIPQFSSPHPILAVGSWSFPDDPTASCAPTRTVPADGALLWVLESRPDDERGNFDPEEISSPPTVVRPAHDEPAQPRMHRVHWLCGPVPGGRPLFLGDGRARTRGSRRSPSRRGAGSSELPSHFITSCSCIIPCSVCRTGDLKVMPTRLMSPWTGLTLWPSWYRHHQAGAAAVLTAVPSACHSEHNASRLSRSATDTHGPLTCGRPTTGARQHEW